MTAMEKPDITDSLQTSQKSDITIQKPVQPVPVVTIKRIYNLPDGTFGIIDIDREPFAFTLELPYRNNEREISSIPRGAYDIERWKSPTFGETFKVCVQFRDNILFHPANLIQELKGCVALGKQIGKLNGGLAILQSKAAFSEFLDKMRWYKKGRLIVEERY